MIEILKQSQEDSQFSIFNKYFPDGKISEVSVEIIPRGAMKYFEGKSSQFISPDKYKPGNFEKFFLIQHADGSKTYLAQQTKTYDTSRTTEKLTYFIDIREEEVVGRSELRHCVNWNKGSQKYFKDKPFVGYTSTKEGMQRTGLGTRRLFMMNAYSLMDYGLPLHSDTLMSPEAEILWEKLAERGMAIKFKEGERDRY